MGDHTDSAGRTKVKGLPVFLRQQFVACSLQQLLGALLARGLVPKDELLIATELAGVKHLMDDILASDHAGAQSKLIVTRD